MFVEIRKEYTVADPPLPIVVCTVGETKRQTAVERESGFPCHHFLFVTRGEGIFEVGEKSFLLREGSGMFCRARLPHAYRPCGDTFATAWVTFYGGERVLDFYGVGDYLLFDGAAALLPAVRELDRVCAGNGTVAERSAAGYSWLIGWLGRHYSPQTPTVERVRRFLETEFSRPLTLDDVAAEAGMDKFALCRYYKKARGKTVMSELRSVRVAKAKVLLRTGEDPVAVIGKSCGFDGTSYFCKIFREETGVSPLEYRRTHK